MKWQPGDRARCLRSICRTFGGVDIDGPIRSQLYHVELVGSECGVPVLFLPLFGEWFQAAHFQLVRPLCDRRVAK